MNNGHYSKMQDRELLYDLYWNQNKSTSDIAKIYGVTFQTVSSWLKRLKIPSRPWTTKGMKFEGHKLSEEHKEKLRKWHTGRSLSPEHRKKVIEGLLKVSKKRTKPLGFINKEKRGYFVQKTGKNKREYVHRIVASESLGRPLIKGEEVHHIDINPSNNNPDNLVVLMRNEHLKLHSQFEYIIGELYSKGVISFDRDQKKYFLV